jgi:hypothetical protein
MTIFALSASTTSAAALVRLDNGEYTAASVAADPTAATNRDLVKEKDGNYRAATAPTPSSGAAAVQSSSAVLAALASLTLGGV